MKEIEEAHRKRVLENRISLETAEEIRLSQKANEEIQLQDEIELERDDSIRKALVQETVDAANESGNPLPPSAIKLMNNFRGNEYYISIYYFMIP